MKVRRSVHQLESNERAEEGRAVAKKRLRTAITIGCVLHASCTPEIFFPFYFLLFLFFFSLGQPEGTRARERWTNERDRERGLNANEKN